MYATYRNQCSRFYDSQEIMKTVVLFPEDEVFGMKK